MKGKAQPRRRIPGGAPDEVSALSAILAHELNNIAVPLRGFIDLTTEQVVTAENVRQCLEEVRIGVERMAGLAMELEGLGADTSIPSAVRLSECLTPVDAQGAEVPYEVDLHCDPLALVTVDLEYARRAISSLAQLAGAPRLAVTDSLPQGAVCATCGARPLRSRDFIQVRAADLRAAISSALTSPFDRSHKIRFQQRLAIAALRHAVHLAGGHVLADAKAEALSIALPKA